MLLDLLIGFFVLVFGFIYKCYCFMKSAVKWMSVPFTWTWEKLRDIFVDRFVFSKRLNDSFSAFDGFWQFLLFCLITLFVSFNIGNSIHHAQTGQYWIDLLHSTTLGLFFQIANEGLNTTPTTLIAVAFGGFLFSACYGTLKYARLCVKIPCFVLYFIMSANLALILTDVFGSAGNWLYTNAMVLMDGTGENLGDQFLTLLIALPLVYILILLSFMSITEYLECAVFGVVGILILQLLNWLSGLLLDALSATDLAYVITEQLVLWGVVFGLEAIKKPLIEMLEDRL